jgi:hypothetical protein
LYTANAARHLVLDRIEDIHAVATADLALGNAKLLSGNPETGTAFWTLGLQTALGHASFLKATELRVWEFSR